MLARLQAAGCLRAGQPLQAPSDYEDRSPVSNLPVLGTMVNNTTNNRREEGNQKYEWERENERVVGSEHGATEDICVSESTSNSQIKALPASVALKVRGGSHAPNIGSFMLQLMYNSLDAKAKNIVIKVCLRTFSLQVRDDGIGMIFEDLRHCGERNFTSKLQHLTQLKSNAFPSYGYHGESLSAIAEFCHLEILSRSRTRPAETCRKVLHNSDAATLTRVLDSTGIGTTVTCRDLFYNRPVARKMLASHDSTASSENASSILQALLVLVRSLAAIHPDVSFTVFDGDRNYYPLPLFLCVFALQCRVRDTCA